MGKVVVTGAAGSIGGRVVDRLIAHPGAEAVVGIDLASQQRSHPKLLTRTIDLAAALEPGQIGDPELESALKGADTVIHLAWRTADERGAPGAGSGVSTLNHRSLARLLGAMSAVGVKKLVQVSSATVYGAWPDNKVPLTEDCPLRPNPEFIFAVDKAEAERASTEWAERNDAALAVLRPAATLGTPERPLYQALGASRSPRSGDGSRPVQFLHADDLASAVVHVWEQRLTGVFNVAPDAGLSEAEAWALAGGVTRLPLPGLLARFASSWSWRFWRRGTPADALAYVLNPWVVAPDKLLATGWSPSYTSEEVLVATDERPHWDDLPPGRRQNYNLVVAGIAATAVVGGAGALARWVLARRHRR